MKYVWSCRIEVESEVELYTKEVDKVAREWVSRYKHDPTDTVTVPRDYDQEASRYNGPEVNVTEDWTARRLM